MYAKDMIVQILDTLIAGLLLGGLFALIAMGLSLQYGVARVLNIAQGEFMMVGAMITWWLFTVIGLNPLLSLVVCGPVTFIIGYFLYGTLFRRLRESSATPGAFEGNSLLASFGLVYIIVNIALIIWGSNIHGYSYLATTVHIGGALFSANRLLTLAFA